MKCNNSACKAYEKKFSDIIDGYSDLPNYDKLRYFADKCISFHKTLGYNGVHASVDMNEVIYLYDNDKSKLNEWAKNYME